MWGREAGKWGTVSHKEMGAGRQREGGLFKREKKGVNLRLDCSAETDGGERLS